MSVGGVSSSSYSGPMSARMASILLPSRITGSCSNDSSGTRLSRAWRPTARLQAGAELAQRLQHDLVVVVVERVEVHQRVAQVGLDRHRGDRHQVEPVVVDELELVAQDLLEQRVEPSRPGVLAGQLAAVGAAAGHQSTSSQLRSEVTTSTSGNDHTKRSTASITSVTCPDDPAMDTKPSSARVCAAWVPVSADAT